LSQKTGRAQNEIVGLLGQGWSEGSPHLQTQSRSRLQTQPVADISEGGEALQLMAAIGS
jgi:hypothetical protein